MMIDSNLGDGNLKIFISPEQTIYNIYWIYCLFYYFSQFRSISRPLTKIIFSFKSNIFFALHHIECQLLLFISILAVINLHWLYYIYNLNNKKLINNFGWEHIFKIFLFNNEFQNINVLYGPCTKWKVSRLLMTFKKKNLFSPIFLYLFSDPIEKKLTRQFFVEQKTNKN